MYVRNDAKSDCLDLRYNGRFIVSMSKPPNVTIDMGDGRTRGVHLNRSKIHPFQGGSPTPLAVNDFTGSHLVNGPLSKVKIRIDTDSVINLRRGIAVHLNRSQVSKNQGQLSQDGLSQSSYSTEKQFSTS